jgi:hypothetical protein
LGEIDSDGLAPFKPGNTITTAEATKIVLEALDAEGVIELPENLEGTPWYAPYIRIAQDLTPYMLEETTQGNENFILTGDEAAQPNHVMTRYEFVEMSARVLKANNCLALDSDNDGLINFDEESVYGTDPYSPDTDEGGVADGTEVARGTDPLNLDDDFEGSVQLDVIPGSYLISEPCVSCPCAGITDYAADVKDGDTVFAIIENEEGEIFGVSNKVTVTDAP